MSKKNKNKKLQSQKMESAQEIGISGNVSENKNQYKGNVPSKVNGAQGGPIGGRMVSRTDRSEENRFSGGNGKAKA
jgi:hypothetical protein